MQTWLIRANEHEPEVTDVLLSKAMQRLSEWKEKEGPALEFHRHNRIHVSKELKRRGQATQIIIDLCEHLQQLDEVVTADMVQKRKNMEAELSVKRKNAANSKLELKNIRKAKLKVQMPVFPDIENILLEYGITSEAYQSGKLNGVDCHELLSLGKTIFECFNGCLLSVSHPGRCCDDIIVQACDLHHDIV